MDFSNLKHALMERVNAVIPDKEYALSIREYMDSKAKVLQEYITDISTVLASDSEQEIQDFKDKYASRKSSTDAICVDSASQIYVKFADFQQAAEDLADDIGADISDVVLTGADSLGNEIQVGFDTVLEKMTEQNVASQVQIEAINNVYEQTLNDLTEENTQMATSVTDFVTLMKGRVSGALASVEGYATYYGNIISSPYLSIREKVSAILANIPGDGETGEVTEADLNEALINVDSTNYSGVSPVESWLFGLKVNWDSVGSAMWSIFKFQMLWPLALIKDAAVGLYKGITGFFKWATSAPIINDTKQGDRYLNVPLYQGVMSASDIMNIKVPAFHKNTGYLPGPINVGGAIPAYRWFGYDTNASAVNFLLGKLSSKTYLDIPFGGLLARLWIADVESETIGLVLYVGMSPDIFDVSNTNQRFDVVSNQVQYYIDWQTIGIAASGEDDSFVTPEFDDIPAIKTSLKNAIRSLTSSWLTLSRCFELSNQDFAEFVQPQLTGSSTVTPFSLSSVQTSGSSGFCSLLKAMYPIGSCTFERDDVGSVQNATYKEWFLTADMTNYLHGNDTTPLGLYNALQGDYDSTVANDSYSVWFYLFPVLYDMFKNDQTYLAYMTGQVSQVTARYQIAETKYYTGRIRCIAIAILAIAAVVVSVVAVVKCSRAIKRSYQRLTARQWELYSRVGALDPVTDPEAYREGVQELVKVQRRLNLLGKLTGNASAEASSAIADAISRYTSSLNEIDQVNANAITTMSEEISGTTDSIAELTQSVKDLIVK